MPPELNASVISCDHINHGLLVLRVRPDGEVPEFEPGQYTVLGLPGAAPRVDYAEPEEPPSQPDKVVKRAYSIASSSLQGEYLEFYVALVHSGALTPRLFALEEGDRIFVGGKVTGMFTLADVQPDHDLIFVSTGTGLAPYISMLRSEYRFDSERSTVVIHGARVSWDLGYRRELEALAARHRNFHYLSVIDEIDRDPTWRGRVGFVTAFFDDGTVEDLLEHEIDPGQTSVFLCGNPLMIEAMEGLLLARDFTVHSRQEPGTLFREKYWKS